MAEQFQICRTCFMFIIQVNIYTADPTPIPVDSETECSLYDQIFVPCRTTPMGLKLPNRLRNRLQSGKNGPGRLNFLPRRRRSK